MTDFTRTYSIFIDAPVHDVFEYCRDPRHLFAGWPALQVEDVTITEQGVGSVARITGRFAKGLVTEEIVREYSEFVPDERITTTAHATVHVAGMTKQVENGPVFTWLFEPEADGTTLRLVVLEKDLSWLENALETVQEKALGKQLYGMLADVKENVERAEP